MGVETLGVDERGPGEDGRGIWEAPSPSPLQAGFSAHWGPSSVVKLTSLPRGSEEEGSVWPSHLCELYTRWLWSLWFTSNIFVAHLSPRRRRGSQGQSCRCGTGPSDSLPGRVPTGQPGPAARSDHRPLCSAARKQTDGPWHLPRRAAPCYKDRSLLK